MTRGHFDIAQALQNGFGTLVGAVIALCAAVLTYVSAMRTITAARKRDEEARADAERVRREDLRRETYVEFLRAYWRRIDAGDFDDDSVTAEQIEAIRQFEIAVVRVQLASSNPDILGAVDAATDAARSETGDGATRRWAAHHRFADAARTDLHAQLPQEVGSGGKSG